MKEIGSDTNQIVMREGKGNNDRVTRLPPMVKAPLLSHLERVRIEHVHSRVKRYHIVHATCRLRKAGIRDLRRDVGCAWHNFRVRVTPGPPMV
jgi:hypothetical protein